MTYLEQIKEVRKNIQEWSKDNGNEFNYSVQIFSHGEFLNDEEIYINKNEHREIIRYLGRRGFIELLEEKASSFRIKLSAKKDPTIKLKSLELMARELKDYYTGYEIQDLLEKCGVDKKLIIYPTSKWLIFYGVFEELSIARDKKGRSLLFKIIAESIHPLNLGGDREKSEKLLEKFNEYLSYDDLIMTYSDHDKKYSINETKDLIEVDENDLLEEDLPGENLPDINKSNFTDKVLKLVADEFKNHLSSFDIRNIITPLLEKNRTLANETFTKAYLNDWLEENAWTYNLENVLKTICKKDEEADKTISEIIMTLLHPLNHGADEEKTEMMAEKIGKYLQYDKFYIQNIGKEYLVLSESEMDEIHSTTPEAEAEYQEAKRKEREEIKQNKEIIRELRDSHQSYIDIIEIFCADTKKPTKELNDAYIFLSNKIERVVAKLGLKNHTLIFYRPFRNDLYSAEIEWNSKANFKQQLSWDAIRPSLYKAHSDIIMIQKISEEDIEMSDEEKKLEDINNLISKKRTEKAILKTEPIKKMEVLHKYEKESSGFYITKKDDDFYYKGRNLNLSKNSDHYKIFSSLFAKLPLGYGEIGYKDLIMEIKSRIPRTKNKTDDQIKKLIQDNITGKQNGFLKSASIPETEDNGKPLIKVVHGIGIAFNNKAG